MISDKPDARLLSEDDLSESEFQRVSPATSRTRRLLTPVLVISLFISIGINLAYFFLQIGPSLDQQCAEHTTLNWSPILDDVEIKYSAVQFNGSVFKQNIYRLPGSPEVDKAWMDLGINARSFPIADSMASKAGLSPGQVKRPDSQGGGFIVHVEALHQLHCLNMVRQGLWYNHKYYSELKQGGWEASDALQRLHVGHCLDIIRQQLMCTADVAVLGQVWVQGKDKAITYPDFNTLHQCRNFDDIVNWVRKHEVLKTDFGVIQKDDFVYPDFP